jgi:hypothetical protein
MPTATLRTVSKVQHGTDSPGKSSRMEPSSNDRFTVSETSQKSNLYWHHQCVWVAALPMSVSSANAQNLIA